MKSRSFDLRVLCFALLIVCVLFCCSCATIDTVIYGDDSTDDSYSDSSGSQDEAADEVTDDKTSANDEGEDVEQEAILFSITFETNGGSEIESLLYCEDDEIILPQPTRDLYEFVGWYLDIEFASECNLTNMPAENIVLYAMWKYDVTINFESNDGSEVESLVLVEGEEIDLSESLREGYEFIGWYTDADLETEFSVNSTLFSEMTLYAKWAIITFDITFVAGQEVYFTEEVGFCNTINEPENPTQLGYSFDGWYIDDAFEALYDFDSLIYEDLTLYAKFSISTFKITYMEANGEELDSETYEYGATIESLYEPTKSGYKFDGWYLDSEYKNAFDTAIIYMPAENITLYAKWLYYATISFDENGGQSVAEITDVEGETIELKESTREGYEFVGWYSDIDLTTEFTLEVMPSEDIILYAKWQINSYSVTFMDGDTIYAEDDADYGSVVSAPIDQPTKEGYNFVGWYSDSDLQSLYDFDTLIEKDTTLYAKFEVASFVITYYDVSGEVLETQSFDFEDTIVLLEDPEKMGYDFMGWYTDNSYENAFDLSIETMPAENLTLYAKWEVITFEVEFIYGEETKGEVVTYGDKVSALDVTLEGYSFGGWFEDESYTTLYNFDFGVTGNLTLYAKFTAIEFSITYYDSDMSVLESQSYYYEESIVFLDDPTKAGYDFMGWYTDNSYENAFYLSIETMPAENLTLYAKWEILSFDVKFVYGDESEIDVVSYGEKVSAIDVSIEGYNFGGWFTDMSYATLYNFDLSVTSDLTLYAKFTIAEFSITYIDDDGEIILEQSYYYGGDITLYSPVKTVYEFVGWYVDADCEVAFDVSIETMAAENLTLYAKWLFIPTISFESGCDMDVESVTISQGQSYELPQLSRDGYEFLGWYYDSLYEDKFDSSVDLLEDITLYASWKVIIFSVIFMVDGVVYESVDVDYENTVSIPAEPEKDGYDFVAWYTSSDFTEIYSFGTAIYSDLILYARFEKGEFTITYMEVDGEELKTISQDYGSDISSLYFVTKNCYTFVGWYLDEDLSEAAPSTMPSENITLYAKWEYNVVISFVSNGGSGISDLVLVEGEEIILETPLRDGYEFLGWYIDSACQTKFDDGTELSSVVTLYAAWEIIYYNVTFVVGSEEYYSCEVVYGGTATAPISTPTQTGYNFICWSVDDALQTSYNFDTVIYGDLTLYAKFEIATFIVVYYDSGEIVLESQSYEYGAAVANLYEPTKAGCTFEGWYLDSDCTIAFSVGSAMPAENLALYAKWQTIYYTVTFLVGDEEYYSYDIDYGSTVTAPIEPAQSGYSFVGWCEDSSLQTLYDFNLQVYGDVVLYASFSVATFTITYYDSTGNVLETQSYAYGADITDLYMPAKVGCNFDGWYLDSEYEYAFDSELTAMPAQNLVLYAKWSVQQLSVDFIYGDLYVETYGDVLSEDISLVVDYGTIISSPQIQSLEGYEFIGWYCDGVKYNFDVAVTSNIMLTAKWDVIVSSVTFVYNDGSDNATVYYEYGEAVEFSAPTRVGYDFVGWYFDAELTIAVSSTQIIYENDLTFYAAWEILSAIEMLQYAYDTILSEGYESYTEKELTSSGSVSGSQSYKIKKYYDGVSYLEEIWASGSISSNETSSDFYKFYYFADVESENAARYGLYEYSDGFADMIRPTAYEVKVGGWIDSSKTTGVDPHDITNALTTHGVSYLSAYDFSVSENITDLSIALSDDGLSYVLTFSYSATALNSTNLTTQINNTTGATSTTFTANTTFTIILDCETLMPISSTYIEYYTSMFSGSAAYIISTSVETYSNIGQVGEFSAPQ